MKLYLVEIKTYGDYQYAYVLAENCESAYIQYRKYLDDNDICFSNDREMESVKLIAEDTNYPSCKTRLFWKEKP